VASFGLEGVDALANGGDLSGGLLRIPPTAAEAEDAAAADARIAQASADAKALPAVSEVNPGVPPSSGGGVISNSSLGAGGIGDDSAGNIGDAQPKNVLETFSGPTSQINRNAPGYEDATIINVDIRAIASKVLVVMR